MNKRTGILYLASPAVPDAPFGQCRWCGRRLVGKRAGSRRYCYLDREGKDCAKAYRESITWNTRHALRAVAQRAGERELRCIDCGVVVEILYPKASYPKQRLVAWEADHEVPLWNGGEHITENLRVRCLDHHKAKTAREATARSHSLDPLRVRKLGCEGKKYKTLDR